MDLITKIKTVLTEPTKFFTKLKKERGIKASFIYLLILGAFSFFMGLILALIFKTTSLFQLLLNVQSPSISNIFLTRILGYFLLIIFTYINSAILFIWIKIFRGKSNFEKTLQIYIYGTTPSFLFGWIPIIGSFVWIYDVILLIIGTSIIHKISKTRSTVLYLIPVALILIIGAILLYLLLMVLIHTGTTGATAKFLNFS